MDTPIRMPFLERRKDNLHIQKPVQPNGATAFPARSLVVLTAGVLLPVVTAGVLVYGQAPDPSHLATDQAPTALFGQNHWPFDLKDSQLVLNITNNAGNVGQAAGAPQLSAAVVGTSYGIYRDANGFQYVNIQDTTNLIFKVIALYPGQALTDYNGLVLVEIVPAALQA